MKSIITTIALAAALLGGCGGSSSDAALPGKPLPTSTAWSTPLINTDCRMWIDEMTRAQNRAVAAQLLRGAWQSDGATGSPSKGLVSKFKTAITDACEGDDSQGIAVAAASAYMGDKATFKP